MLYIIKMCDNYLYVICSKKAVCQAMQGSKCHLFYTLTILSNCLFLSLLHRRPLSSKKKLEIQGEGHMTVKLPVHSPLEKQVCKTFPMTTRCELSLPETSSYASTFLIGQSWSCWIHLYYSRV